MEALKTIQVIEGETPPVETCFQYPLPPAPNAQSHYKEWRSSRDKGQWFYIETHLQFVLPVPNLAQTSKRPADRFQHQEFEAVLNIHPLFD